MMSQIFKGLFLLGLVVGIPTHLVSAADLAPDSNFVYDDHGKRDPLWTLLGHRGAIVNYDNDIQAIDMVLEGIMAEPTGDSVAIINVSILKVGDKVGFFIVKEIQNNAVVMQKGQEIFTLKLKKEE